MPVYCKDDWKCGRKKTRHCLNCTRNKSPTVFGELHDNFKHQMEES